MAVDTTYPTHAVGRRQRVVIQTETGDLSESITSWAGAKLILHSNDGVITDTVPDVRATPKRLTLDAMAADRVPGKHDATFSIEADIRPSGSAGTAPELGPLLVAAGLTETVDAGVSVTYSPASDYSATVHVLEDLESMSRLLQGGYVETLEVALTGDAPPKVTLSGRGTRVVRCGYTTTTAAAAATDTAVSVAECGTFDVGAWIKFGAEDNGGAGYRVTAKSAESGAGTLTITPGLAAAVASGADVGPYCPDPTEVGVLLPVTAGSVSIGGVDLELVSATLRVANTVWDDRNRVATDRLRARRITGREVTLEMTLYATRGAAIYGMRASAVYPVAITIGDTAGRRLELTAPRARITDAKPAVEVGEGAVTLSVSTMLEGDAGNDSFAMVFS